MSSPEIPDEERYLPVPADLIIPDDVFDEAFEAINKSRNEALEELVPTMGRLAVVSQPTSPNSFHYVPMAEGEILIRTKNSSVNTARKCWYISVNQVLRVGPYSEEQLETHDFLVSNDFKNLGYYYSKVFRKVSSNAWDITDRTGTVLHKMQDKIIEQSGNLAPHDIRITHNQSPIPPLIEAAEVINAATLLSSWLSILSKSTYDEELSRTI